MNNFNYTYIVLCYLSSKLVVAAEFKTMSISFHISSLNIESSIPKFSWQMLPEIGVTFSNIKDSRFAPKFFLRTLNKSFPNTCKYTVDDCDLKQCCLKNFESRIKIVYPILSIPLYAPPIVAYHTFLYFSYK